MHVKRPTPLHDLTNRYQRAEDAGLRDLLLAVLFAAGGLATGGVVLLAFVQTRAVLALAFGLAVAATLAVLATIAAMLGGEDSVHADDHAPAATDLPRRRLRSAGGRFARPPAQSSGVPLPR